MRALRAALSALNGSGRSTFVLNGNSVVRAAGRIGLRIERPRSLSASILLMSSLSSAFCDMLPLWSSTSTVVTGSPRPGSPTPSV